MSINFAAMCECGHLDLNHHRKEGACLMLSCTCTSFHAAVPTTVIPVPDGMTVEDAERILAEHVEWVPLPREQWKDVPGGARLRVVATGGDVHVITVLRQSERYIVTADYLYGGVETESVYIHPDDAPTDPDAEMVAHLINVLSVHALDDPAFTWEDAARDAIAAVREHEAQR